MGINAYFQRNNFNEQKLIQSIIDEEIRNFGINVIYIPRECIAKDEIINEYFYSKFDKYFNIEMFLLDAGFQNHSFNTDIYGVVQDEIHLVVSKNTWMTFVRILNKEHNNFSDLYDRPREGDLIYIDFLKNLYEITLVDHQMNFYTFEKLYTYRINCETYRYSSEKSNIDLDVYKNISLDSGLVRILKLTNYGNEIDFKELETVILRGTNETAKVVAWNKNNSELYIREIDGDFKEGIVEGLESGAYREIYNESNKKLLSSKKPKNKELEDSAQTFYIDVDNPFLK